MSESKREEAYRIAVLDLECVPNEKATYSDKGKLVVDTNARNTIQLAVCELDGTVVVPEMNINPCVDWKKNEGFLSYTAKCWKVKKEEVPVSALQLPVFSTAIRNAVVLIEEKLGKNVILCCHNGKQWDIPILHNQCKANGILITLLNGAIGFDTRFIMCKLGKKPDSKDKTWALDTTYKRLFEQPISRGHTASADTQALGRLLREYMRQKGIHKEAELVKRLFNEERKGIFELPWSKGFVAAEKATEGVEWHFKQVVDKIKNGKGAEKFKDPELEKLFIQLQKLTI